MKVKKQLNYSQSQLIEVLDNSQLCENLRGFRLSSNLPTNYKFVFHLQKLNDTSLFVKKVSEQKKKITFCEQKEIKQIHSTHLAENYFKPLQTFNNNKKTSIRINFLDIDFSLKEITF